MIIRGLTGIWYDKGYKGYLVHNVVIRSLQHIIITQPFFSTSVPRLLLSCQKVSVELMNGKS